MSGGHWNYNQYRIDEIADSIDQIIKDETSTELNEYGDAVSQGYSAATLIEFRLAIAALRVAATYAGRIDWLLSGDDAEDSFHRRLREQLLALQSAP